MIDRKISNKELSEQGLTIDGVEIVPPTPMQALAQLRGKRKIPYYKITGKIYYQASDLIEWVNKKKVEIV